MTWLAEAQAGSARDNMKIRVIVADDQKPLRDSVRAMLARTDDIEVVGTAEDGHRALELIRALRPDLVVMDVQMPRLGGIEATRRIVSEHPTVKVIALSIHADKQLVDEMFKAPGHRNMCSRTSLSSCLPGPSAPRRGTRRRDRKGDSRGHRRR